MFVNSKKFNKNFEFLFSRYFINLMQFCNNFHTGFIIKNLGIEAGNRVFLKIGNHFLFILLRLYNGSRIPFQFQDSGQKSLVIVHFNAEKRK